MHAHMARTPIGLAGLYAELDREFRANRSAKCGLCRVPLPYWSGAPDEVSANWVIGNPSLCPHGCHSVIAEVLASLWTRYDLIGPDPSNGH
jgi:hypothetical protein